MSNLKTHVIIVSEQFPSTHKRKGEETFFVNKIKNELKKHTIRKNYQLWKKRVDEVNKGRAVISIRTWSGKPYNSPQVEKFQLTKENNVGVQKIQFTKSNIYIDERRSAVSLEELANNDGLSLEDFQDWFKKYPKEPMAIIHFIGFRYYKFL